MNNIRYASVIIAINGEEEIQQAIYDICKNFANIIINRVDNELTEISGSRILTLVLRASNDEIGAFTGKLGSIRNVKLKTAFLPE